MEKEHLIIIAILAVILYMCMNKSEKFYGLTEEERRQGTLFAQNIRYGLPPPDIEGQFAQNIRYEKPYGEQFAQNIRRGDAYTCVKTGDGQEMCQKQGGNDAFAQRVRRNDMNIMGSQYITGHIRNDRRNNMMNSMMYGYQCEGADCGDSS